MVDPFSLPFFQRGIIEILLLAVVAGLLGVWIVLRGLSFYAHAVGTAAVPGLVLADGLGFSAIFGAFGAALAMAALVSLLVRRRSVGADSATALALAGALALGVILASDVFASQGSVDRLLFGSLLAIGRPELIVAAVAALASAAATLLLGPRWLAAGFADRRGRSDYLLVVLIALCAVAALAAVGALLATAILVVPAATTRLVVGRLRAWQAATVLLAAAEGVLGMVLAYRLDVPPGAAIAVVAGVVFALAAAGKAAIGRRSGAMPATASVALLVALIAGGCAGAPSPDPNRLTVSATTAQVGDLVREVGGGGVNVNQILEPNSEAHDYEPRPSDVASVAGSALLFTSGLGLDQWSAKLLEQSGADARVVDLGSLAPVKRTSADQTSADPHWWHDLTNLEAATVEVERALVSADPADAAAFRANGARYRRKIMRADAQIRACLSAVPARERTIVTDHDAFIYFTERYGVTSVGAVFPSTSTQSQASAGEVAALERTIRERKVRAIFPENSLNPALAQRIAADTGVSSDYKLYGDTLGPDGTAVSTVLGAEAANAQAIVAGISGGSKRCAIKF
ncbi:MAG: hypothetical protein F2813_05660 [Actinobacteria bacterium]|uniref:Unannotated protein n=1 Tax=freshwater metagenome TaxID=449393 RepID=A0A6J6A1M7_9ZZZZ|nr:hypothetical protein [Actinomycetota bacterium]